MPIKAWGKRMRRILLVIFLPLIFFALEFLWKNLLGGLFKPEFMVLLIVFFDLSLGIRYGLAVAFWGGVIKDSFAVNIFGMHILSYVICAFLAVIVRRYLFHSSSYSLRILLAFLMSLLNAGMLFVLHSRYNVLDFKEAFTFVIFPQVLSTTLIAGFTFHQLRKCVLRFSA